MNFLKASLYFGYFFLGVFLVAPLLFIFLQVAGGIGEIYHLLADPFYFNLSAEAFEKAVYVDGSRLVVRGPDLGVVLNSIWVALTVAAVDTALGFVLAYVLAKYVFRGGPPSASWPLYHLS